METLKPRLLPVAQNGFDLRDHYFVEVLTLIPDYQPCLVLRSRMVQIGPEGKGEAVF